MAAVVVEIAEAMVTALNAATLSQDFTATRGYAPSFDLTDFEDGEIRVTVIPAELELGARDLGPRLELLWAVGVWVQRKADETAAEFDPLMLLVEEIVQLFHGWRTHPDYRVIGMRAAPPFDRELPHALGLFTASVVVTFRFVR